jgi:hypothetical protein
MINPADAAEGKLIPTQERERMVYRTRFRVASRHYLEDDDLWQIFLVEEDGMSAIVLTVTPTQADDWLEDTMWTSEVGLEPY